MKPPPLLVWLRAETRPSELRTPLVPAGVARLVGLGIEVVVERSTQRFCADAGFAAAGATLAEPGSWVDAPAHAHVLGLKELPAGPALRHRHIYFGHAYKGQPGAAALLRRFAEGGGELLDLEYLCGPDGRRLVAFSFWAGYVGAALAVLHHDGRLTVPLVPTTRADLDAALATPRSGPPLRVLVLGAWGRSGSGARAALEQAGIRPTLWDAVQTRDLDRTALLDHHIVINTVLIRVPTEPFLTAADLVRPGRALSVLSDVTCDIGSPTSVFPLYDEPTTWSDPVRRLPGPPPLDAIVIDNLPSVLPREASESFSEALVAHLPELADDAGVWSSTRAAFDRARSVPDPRTSPPETQEPSNV